MICTAMQTNTPYIIPIHSIFKYRATKRKHDPYNRQIIGVVGDRYGSMGPSFVKIINDQIKLKSIKLVIEKVKERYMSD